jgi:hypothetical protein
MSGVESALERNWIAHLLLAGIALARPSDRQVVGVLVVTLIACLRSGGASLILLIAGALMVILYIFVLVVE